MGRRPHRPILLFLHKVAARCSWSVRERWEGEELKKERGGVVEACDDIARCCPIEDLETGEPMN